MPRNGSRDDDRNAGGRSGRANIEGARILVGLDTHHSDETEISVAHGNAMIRSMRMRVLVSSTGMTSMSTSVQQLTRAASAAIRRRPPASWTA